MLDIPNIDLNMKGVFSENDPANSKFYDGQPTLHMLVLQNNYEMLKQCLEFSERHKKAD